MPEAIIELQYWDCRSKPTSARSDRRWKKDDSILDALLAGGEGTSIVSLSTQPMSDVPARDFVKLVEMADAERIFMFSTDYPHWNADSASAVLPKAIPEGLQKRIRYRNPLESYPRLEALVNAAARAS